MTNLLFITADQWRGDCLSALDHPVVRTPNLDAIAAGGTLFEKHYANAVPCGPSRACLHTGMYLHNHRSGTNGTPLDLRFTNWAKELRGAGYDPVLFGYTHTAMDPRGLPLADPRLQTDEGILPGITPVIDMGTHCREWKAYLAELGYPVPDFDGATYGQRDEDYRKPDHPKPMLYDAAHTDTAFLVSRARQYIGEQSGPWAVHLSLRAPHPPWVAPAPYNEHYHPASLPGCVRHDSPEAEAAVHPWLTEHLAGRNVSHTIDARHRHLQASYYGLMSEVDQRVGELVAWLQAAGQWADTLFIFTSDHGEQMGDHWMYGKAGFFDQSYHIPLLICGPGVSRGHRCTGFTEHVDLMPTLMDCFGLTTPRQCDGASLVPALSGSDTARAVVHFEYDFRHSEAQHTLALDMESACLNVIRDDHYKYVHFADLPALLFDLRADPGELHDLTGERPDIVADYAQRLLSWRLRTTDKTLSHYQVVRGEGLQTRGTAHAAQPSEPR